MLLGGTVVELFTIFRTDFVDVLFKPMSHSLLLKHISYF